VLFLPLFSFPLTSSDWAVYFQIHLVVLSPLSPLSPLRSKSRVTVLHIWNVTIATEAMTVKRTAAAIFPHCNMLHLVGNFPLDQKSRLFLYWQINQFGNTFLPLGNKVGLSQLQRRNCFHSSQSPRHVEHLPIMQCGLSQASVPVSAASRFNR
jgi:hypothetical protein